jgi:hypothetical protein
LARVSDDDLAEEALDDLVGEVAAALDDDPEQAPFWRLVDDIARLRQLSEAEQVLVADIIEVAARHAGRAGRRRA